MMMKRLQRIRLINWHYFVNETIDVSGSFLVSGENTAGKSTVLDAIQLVLTTNKRKFNTAANEKSNRNLKGYVRCKTGNENSAYMRSGSIIGYVALEFYEEKTGKTFVTGVKIDSPDEEAQVVSRWFVVEDDLDAITFLKGNRPATTEEFRRKGKKIPLIMRDYEAKDRFARRMGNLDPRFFDIIPKSLAFKPMDNVKDFINKFILAEKTIEVASLRRNIESLKELEDLMEETRKKIKELEAIQATYNEISQRKDKIIINDILIAKANLVQVQETLEQLKKEHIILGQGLKAADSKVSDADKFRQVERDRMDQYKSALNSHENSAMIMQVKQRLIDLGRDFDRAKSAFRELKKAIKTVETIAVKLKQFEDSFTTREDLLKLTSEEVLLEEKVALIHEIDQAVKQRDEHYSDYFHKARTKEAAYKDEKVALINEIKQLNKKQITYPKNTVRLKEAIERTFKKRGIERNVYVFCELLEINDTRWQNAVEGYLNTQRFNIIVEPRDYDLALEVYNKIRNEVHTVGLVNTGKLNLEYSQDNDSLFAVVRSENRYANAYAAYLLNRVVRCNDVHKLKEHRVAITDHCMLYQNHTVRKINQDVYKIPYIGARAIEIQLMMKEARLEEVNQIIPRLVGEIKAYRDVIEVIRMFRINDVLDPIDSPLQVKRIGEEITIEKQNLKEVESDPTYIELKMKVDELEVILRKAEEVYSTAVEERANKKAGYSQLEERLGYKSQELAKVQEAFEGLIANNEALAEEGIQKYEQQAKNKDIGVIITNFERRSVALQTEINDRTNKLGQQQYEYCNKFETDLNTGFGYIKEYDDEHYKLVSSEIIRYDEELKKAKENCQREFRESFLARLKEYIESAKNEFKHLNKALKGIYYGEDSYKFEITYNKKKESIYKMIMSEWNQMETFNLFSNMYTEEFEEEMDDLFSKLTAYDDQGENILSEYTDYRRYLDYDIVVSNAEGQTQRFSKIYGEKSGGETQTPYYVAIAASFTQLYKLGDTVRIIMFDEAFDKMDDNRIASMMDFLNSQGFQIILATPPSKLEVIGEKVDTILMAMREGSTSIVEAYDL